MRFLHFAGLSLLVLAMLLVRGRAGDASPGSSAWAENLSYATTCAEEDNVNVPIFAPEVHGFRVSATHPTYEVGIDNCAADFSGCDSGSPATRVEAADLCSEVFNDGVDVVEVCVVSDWWRPYSMNVMVDDQAASGHYLRWYRKIAGENNWPQFLVLYQDGNMRLKPHPPEGRADVCFSSSVIIGPAAPNTRPYVDIEEVDVSPSTSSLRITYREGGEAELNVSVDRAEGVAEVEVGYETAGNPIATFRSMWVVDGNSDVDHIEVQQGDLPILGSWTSLAGPWWLFHREVRSTHNTSAPDILIEVDTDGDGVLDSIDNCPATANAGQENADGDAWGDACENCPAVATVWWVPVGDGDCDGFTDDEEDFTATDPADACPDNVDDDAWPADLVHTTLGYGKHDGKVNILDIVHLTPPVFGTSPPDPNYNTRKDFNGDSVINILDIVRLTPPMFGQSCTP